jgi:nucleoside-diphosphate-sugar epimerase
MRVLVIGGTGTLGSVVVDELLAAGADVQIVSRGRRRRRNDVEHLIGDVRSGDGL